MCVCSVPASVSDVASSPPADSAETGSGAAEGALPLPQHQAGQWTGLCVPVAGSRLQPVRTHTVPHQGSTQDDGTFLCFKKKSLSFTTVGHYYYVQCGPQNCIPVWVETIVTLYNHLHKDVYNRTRISSDQSFPLPMSVRQGSFIYTAHFKHSALHRQKGKALEWHSKQ